jgi:hypothetical protein
MERDCNELKFGNSNFRAGHMSIGHVLNGSKRTCHGKPVPCSKPSVVRRKKEFAMKNVVDA